MMIKKNQKVKRKKFKVEQVSELKFLCFIVKESLEQPIVTKLSELGARTFMIKHGEGISKNKSLETLGIQKTINAGIFATARQEDAYNILVAIFTEFNLDAQGNGLGFIIDVDGYMGAKGLFLE